MLCKVCSANKLQNIFGFRMGTNLNWFDWGPTWKFELLKNQHFLPRPVVLRNSFIRNKLLQVTSKKLRSSQKFLKGPDFLEISLYLKKTNSENHIVQLEFSGNRKSRVRFGRNCFRVETFKCSFEHSRKCCSYSFEENIFLVKGLMMSEINFSEI